MLQARVTSYEAYSDYVDEDDGEDISYGDAADGGSYDSPGRRVEPGPGTFELELRTHDNRTMTVTGHRALFSDPTRMATEAELHQLAERIVVALNAATRDPE
jgi:hypothetical protein